MKRSHLFILIGLVLLFGAAQLYFLAPDKALELVRPVIDKVKGETKPAKPDEDLGPIRIGYGYYTANKREAFSNGILMAVDQINANPKGVFKGRKLEAVEVDLPTTSNPSDMWDYAKDISEQNFVATILSAGGGGENAIIGSAVFEKYRIINLWPYTTTTKLTQHNFKYTFRNIANNNVQAEVMAKVCESAGCKNVGIVYVRSSTGEELASLLNKHINHLDDAVVTFYQSIYPDQKDYFPIITRLLTKHQTKKLDAVFFSGSTREAIPFIKMLRDFKLDMPVVLGISQNDPKFLEVDANGFSPVYGSVVVGIFDDDDLENKQFIQEYNQKFQKKLPSYTTAAQAYDSVMLLVEAMRYAKSTDPDSMVSYLRYGGALASDKKKKNVRRHYQNGEIISQDYFLQIVCQREGKDGKHVYYFDTYRKKDACIFHVGNSCLRCGESDAAQ
ncbi:MAG: ABC transporter substrate-binding protein [Magnetococcales bacterium]|nr:ABC transporter substrate-binding protein [Magnetococcales bacterium]